MYYALGGGGGGHRKACEVGEVSKGTLHEFVYVHGGGDQKYLRTPPLGTEDLF